LIVTVQVASSAPSETVIFFDPTAEKAVGKGLLVPLGGFPLAAAQVYVPLPPVAVNVILSPGLAVFVDGEQARGSFFGVFSLPGFLAVGGGVPAVTGDLTDDPDGAEPETVTLQVAVLLALSETFTVWGPPAEKLACSGFEVLLDGFPPERLHL
jgi:hypothetical protein